VGSRTQVGHDLGFKILGRMSLSAHDLRQANRMLRILGRRVKLIKPTNQLKNDIHRRGAGVAEEKYILFVGRRRQIRESL